MHILYLAALLLQFGVVLIGFPAQISRNYERNECGEAAVKVTILLSSFVTRFASTAIDGIWYVYLPDIFGVMLLVVTCSQLKKPRNPVARLVHKSYRGAVDFLSRKRNK
jgi:hypothetical protein